LTTDPITRTLPVSRDRAWLLLEDPRSLKILVVGARAIRHFDPRWPEVGTVVHHSVGVAPLVIRDTTVVTGCEPGRHLVLEARVRPFGRFEVDFRLREHADGCVLEVRERVLSGPLSTGPMTAVTEFALRLRNAELSRRFLRLIERREQQYERLVASRAGPDA
jgi:hypothetical protein